MFEDVLRNLKGLERGVQVQIEMPLDDDGYFDRLCSHEECQREFKVLFQDWKEKVSDEKVYCPFCGHNATSGDWNTEEQTRYIRDFGLKCIKGQLDKAFSDGARKFNRRQPRNGFITMKMEYKPGHLVATHITVAGEMKQPFRPLFYQMADRLRYLFCGGGRTDLILDNLYLWIFTSQGNQLADEIRTTAAVRPLNTHQAILASASRQ